jgi:hypothetical protein
LTKKDLAVRRENYGKTLMEKDSMKYEGAAGMNLLAAQVDFGKRSKCSYYTEQSKHGEGVRPILIPLAIQTGQGEDDLPDLIPS